MGDTKKYTYPDNPTLNDTPFEKTDKGNIMWGEINSAKNALAKHGDFTYSKGDIYNDVMDKILNREKFSYDLNGDAFYQQYKDKYIKQGQLAMQDTMGQAAAMTGGYGNSYAQSVGQQAYNAQLDKLNDVGLQLYQMAYDRYNQEGQDLYNKYGMLSEDKQTEYGMWGDKYNRLVADRDYATNSYYNAADLYGTDVDRANSIAQNTFTNAMAILQNEQDTDRWEADHALDERQVAVSEGELELKKNSLSDNSSPGGNTENNNVVNNNKGEGWDNGSVRSADIEAIQKYLGISVDGKWGSNSRQAALDKWGVTSPEDAYSKFMVRTQSIDSPEYYADWDGADWEGFFATIRSKQGKIAAQVALDEYNKKGLIPKEFVSMAGIGARGSLGH